MVWPTTVVRGACRRGRGTRQRPRIGALGTLDAVTLELRLKLPLPASRYGGWMFLDRAITGTSVPIADTGATLEFQPYVGPLDGVHFAHMGDATDPVAVGARFVVASVPIASDSSDDLRLGLEKATRAFTYFRRWARLAQPWTGPPDELVSPLDGLGFLRDTETGAERTVRVPNFAGGSHVVGGDFVTLDDLDRAASGEIPPIEDELLADARLLGHWSNPRDGVKAVLLAAMACEQKAKRVLTDRAAGNALLDWLLSNQRAFPYAARDLFDAVPKALFGRSLRAEDPDLHKEVAELFEARNRIAHVGARPDDELTRVKIAAAMRAFQWLDTLP